MLVDPPGPQLVEELSSERKRAERGARREFLRRECYAVMPKKQFSTPVKCTISIASNRAARIRRPLYMADRTICETGETGENAVV
jgi:hypothetical protein